MANDFPSAGRAPSSESRRREIEQRLTYRPDDPDGPSWHHHYVCDVSYLLGRLQVLELQASDPSWSEPSGLETILGFEGEPTL